MIAAFRQRLLKASFSYMNRCLLGSFPLREDNASHHWHALLEQAGLSLERIIRVRKDSRGVFLVKHPQWERCVLKTYFTLTHADGGLAKLLIAKLVSESGAELFPKVHAATENYTIEEYIDGTPFRKWMASPEYRFESVERYFLSLIDWSRSTRFAADQGPLHPYEIQEICRSYIRKCFWLSRYCTPMANVAAISRLSSLGGGLRQRIDRLVEESYHLVIPRCMMTGDMGNVNLLAQRETQRIYNIDYEFMAPGHWAFDCAYFISSLRKMRDAEELVAPIEQLVFSEEQLGNAELAGFFREFTGILCDVSRLLFRPAPTDPVRAPALAAPQGNDVLGRRELA